MKISIILAALSLTVAAAPAPEPQWWWRTRTRTRSVYFPRPFPTRTTIATSVAADPTATPTSDTPIASTTTTTTTTTRTTTTTTTTTSTTSTVVAPVTTTTTTTTSPSRSATTTVVTSPAPVSPSPSTSSQPSTTVATTSQSSGASVSSAAPGTRTTRALSGDYAADTLLVHNTHRANHSESALTWNDTLVYAAKGVAEGCIYAHNTSYGGGGYGQNIMAGPRASSAAGAGGSLFYNNEINSYPQPYGNDNPDMSNFHAWGHYSQIAWASTQSVGCYTADCSANGLANVGGNVPPYFTVCNYYPPGNYGGRYSQVKQPKGDGTVIFTPGG